MKSQIVLLVCLLLCFQTFAVVVDLEKLEIDGVKVVAERDVDELDNVDEVEEVEAVNGPFKSLKTPGSGLTATTMLITWEFKSGAKESLKDLQIQVKRDGDTLFSSNVDKTPKRMTLIGLAESTKYTVKMRGRKKNGSKTKWSTIKPKTKEFVDDNKSGYLKLHNAFRKQYGMPTLKWSSKIANSAKAYANQLANSCGGLVHSSSPYGENLASQTNYKNTESAVTAWVYTEHTCYQGSSSQCSCTCGHFTQVLWKASDWVGCGSASCSTSNGPRTYFVCQYARPGNCNGLPYDAPKSQSICGPFSP